MNKGNVARKVIEEVLRDLETKLAAYLDDWRRELGIWKGPEAGFDREELRLIATEQKDER